MQSSHSLSRLSVAFFDRHAVADAGLLLPATLAEKFGRRRALCDELVDLGDAPGAGNVGVKGMTLIFSALAGGDSIDDANMLRAGSTEAVLGCEVQAPPPWAPSCGPSPGATPCSSTPSPGICSPTRGAPASDRALSPSPSTWIPPSAKPTASRKPGEQVLLHPRAGLPPPARRGRRHGRGPACPPAGRSGPTPPGAFLVSSPRRFSGYERPEPYGKPPWPGDRLRLLQPQGAGLPQKGRALLHHHPAPQTPASDDRRPAGGGLDRHPLRPA